MSEWQDISTAPTGKEILGYQATPGDNENRMGVCWAYVMHPNVVWFGHGGLMPTHWMPLPEPPVQS